MTHNRSLEWWAPDRCDSPHCPGQLFARNLRIVREKCQRLDARQHDEIVFLLHAANDRSSLRSGLTDLS